jgi:hypothetical protein
LARIGVAIALMSWPAWVSAQGNPVGPEFRVNSYTTGEQYRSAVAMDGAGSFVAVWESDGQDGSGRGVFGQRYDGFGAPIGPEFQVNTYTTSQQFFPSVASDPAGNFVVVWSSDGQDGSENGVFGQRYAQSGAPLGAEFRVNTYTTSFQTVPSVGMDGSGNFVVVWFCAGKDGSYFGIFGQRYAAAGTPLGPEFQVNSYTTQSQIDPSVAVAPSGNFLVAWSGAFQDGSVNGVFAQRYDSSGTPAGPEFRVNTFTSLYQERPEVLADGSGNFVVVWESWQDGSSFGIFGQRYAASGMPLGPEFRVNTTTSNYQLFPAGAVDAGGNFVVTWSSLGQDGSGYGVFGQRYAVNGMPLGSEFRVNSATVGNQAGSSVAASPSGTFVVLWSSALQDGSVRGVYGQRYDAILPVELIHFHLE